MKKRKMLRTTTLIVFVLVVAVLLTGAYFLVYRNVSNYNNKLNVLQSDLLVNFQNKVDETLVSGKEYLSSWCLENEIIKFATEDKFDSSNLMDIYNNMGKRYFLFKDMDCVYGIFRVDKDMFITNVGIIHADNLEKKYDFDPDCMSYIQSIANKEFVNGYYLADDSSASGQRINLFIKREILGGDKAIYGFISLNLKEISDELSRADDNVFLAYNGDNCLFNSQPDDALSGSKAISKQSNAVHNLRYEISTVKQNNIFLWIIYLLLALVLIVVGMFGSIVLARFLYRPVENVLMQITGGESLDIYDEESYINNYFVEMNEVNQQLSSKISTQEQYLRQNYLREMLYGMKYDDNYHKDNKHWTNELHGNIVMAVLAEKKSNMQGVLMSNQITALLTAKIDDSFVVFLNSEQVVVIAKGHKFENFKTLIVQAVLQISEWYDVSYIGAVGMGKIDSPNGLHKIFNDTVQYLQNEDFIYDKLIVTKDDFSEDIENDNSYYYPLEYEKNIINCMANNEFDNAVQMLRIILDKNLVETRLSKSAMTELKFAFVNTIKRVLQSLKHTEVEIFGEGSILYLELSSCKTAEEFADKVLELFKTINNFTENICNNASYMIIDKMEEYIRDNYYKEEMSLLLLAEHFNLTTSYISRIFKKHRQENFKDYLVEYRIQKATEILDAQPYIRVSDLAQKVGYSNVNSFIRNFKKLKHISPGEYKKLP